MRFNGIDIFYIVYFNDAPKTLYEFHLVARHCFGLVRIININKTKY